MLPSSQRISSGQFKKIMEKGRVCHSSFFLIRFERDDSIEHACVSVIAAQKIAKTAVLRNMLRRRMYAAVQHFYAQLDPHVHALIFMKKTAMELNFEDLQSALKDVFVKAGILK